MMAKPLKTKRDLLSLRRGDILRHVGNGAAYVVVSNCGPQGLIVTTTIIAMNPTEWEAVTIHGKPV